MQSSRVSAAKWKRIYLAFAYVGQTVVYGAILIIFFVSNVLRVREFIPAATKCATLRDHLEIQGHVIFLVPYLSQLVHTLKQRISLFLMLYGLGHSFQQLQNAWP